MARNRELPRGARRALSLRVLLGVALLAGCGAGGSPASAPRTTTPGPGVESARGPTQPVVKVPLEKCPASTANAGGDRLPSLTLSCMGLGPAVDMAAGHGKPTVVNLWASWCVPCRAEMPRLRTSAAKLGASVTFLGVDVKDDPGAAWAFLRKTKVRYPNVADPSGGMLAGLRVPGVPITFVLDSTGAIVYRHIGELHEEDITQMENAAHAAP